MSNKKATYCVIAICGLLALGGTFIFSRMGSNMVDGKITEEIAKSKKAESKDTNSSKKEERNSSQLDSNRGDDSGASVTSRQKNIELPDYQITSELDFSKVETFVLSYNSLVEDSGIVSTYYTFYSEKYRCQLRADEVGGITMFSDSNGVLIEVSIKKTPKSTISKVKEVMGSDVKAEIEDINGHILISNIIIL